MDAADGAGYSRALYNLAGGPTTRDQYSYPFIEIEEIMVALDVANDNRPPLSMTV